MAKVEESAEFAYEGGDSRLRRPDYLPPPGPPVYVQMFGYTPGLEKKQRKAREAWERKYGEAWEQFWRANDQKNRRAE